MIQPSEMKQTRPMELSHGVLSTTTQVWNMLVASRDGNLLRVKELANECPELMYAQYNYAPPIHFAVREGHIELVEYLLEHGAHDPDYRIYPFLDSLQTIATDRHHDEIASLLDQYARNTARHKYKGDNGSIDYNRSAKQQEFEDVISANDIEKTAEILKTHPEFALDETYFWSEGVLTMPVQHQQPKLVELLLSYGAKVSDILKWTQFYYFKFYDSAAHIMEKGMNPNTMSWQHVTILHDMAQKGDIRKAELLLRHGAYIDPLEEQYHSTPLGMAARWGQAEMVDYLLQQGADPNKSASIWSTPLAWAKKKGHHAIEKTLLKAGAR